MWEDMLIDRQVDDDTLRQAVAEVFTISVVAVSLVGDIEDTLDTSLDGVHILLVRARAEGDFPLQITAYLRDEALSRRVESWTASVALVKRFAELLGCTALIGDETVDPLAWLRIDPTGAVVPVTLDDDRLERDEYVIARQRTEHPAQTVV